MPSLPLHLASLSQLLSTRLELHQPLLSLSGRLDLALAQITMRRIAAEQAAANAAEAQVGGGKGSQGERYIEGESSDEEDVQVEVDDGEGEIEDVDMRGGDSSEDEEWVDLLDPLSGMMALTDGNRDDEDEHVSEDDDEDEDPLDSGSEGGLEGGVEESEDEESGSEEE
jgi:U3 small nucleolar RNA-associated protein 5